jgi:hypothetical protein
LYKGGSSNLSWNYEVCSFFGNPPAFLRLNTTGNENFFTDGSIVNVAGNDDINGSSAVKIFPNPCNSYFKLIVPDCYKFCRAEIVSFTGLLLDSFLITGDRTTTCTLPADLKEGLYFIRIIKGNSETESYKLLVNR